MAELLGLIQAYDRNFVPDDLDVKAFRHVAVTHRWNKHEAETAIHKWGGDHPQGQRMDAALLNQLIRTQRQDALMRQPVATAYGPPMAEETVRQRVMAIWRQEARNSKDRSRARKAMIAKYPDLVERFNAIGFMAFSKWNGWVAPATVPSEGPGATGPTTDAGQGYKPNLSHIRAAVVEIETEATSRETAS